MFAVNFKLIGLIGAFYFVRAERCFHCTDIADPGLCTKVETCGPDQVCSIRQYVQYDGTVLYSLGCRAKTTCPALGTIVGRRDMSRQDTAVTTCVECCDKDYCNIQGCNTQVVSRDKRGPYCFTCDATMDPSTCNDVTICQESEECIVFESQDLTSSSQTVYKSMCESKAACAAFSNIGTHGNCPPVCCQQDFCNDKCFTNGVNPGACDTSAGYQLIQDSTGSASLCIQIYTHHEDWDSARAACSSAGGDLVVLDNKDEAILLKNTILTDSHYNHQTGYWIGARDFDLTNVFTWVTNTTVDLASGDWFPGQPNHHDGGHDQNCANMWRGSSNNPQDYQWHDDYCSKPLAFICQQS
ncbi:uncharacterized protein LOC132716880 [Ruditapes philippinarum]|uniref:uncharacterized protein LOC132716880 n=1 Tax=Ruditapes philippinarum TaxID=129788 RepID=UPI00295BEE3C|nr:uncharacterized protein LOC132716880 [Ruditapes philippinarum]